MKMSCRHFMEKMCFIGLTNNVGKEKTMKEVKGDLIKLAQEGEFDVIVHGCNCFHTMGAGLASQIARKYPQAYESDRINSIYGDPEKMGTYTKSMCDGVTVINGYTQFSVGKAPMENRELAIQVLFEKIAKDFPNARIGVPFIGAGIAGGDWSRIKAIIKHALDDVDFTIVEYQP